jgi:acyl-CoA synthetase (AMP-forming)/AMP-acid ligase II
MDVRLLMRRSAAFYRALPAVVVGERSFTYEQAWQRGVRMANRLLALGLAPGDRVAILDDNSVELVDCVLGTVIANLVRVPLYARNGLDSHALMLAGTQARAAIVGSRYLSLAESLQASTASLEHVIRCDDSY